MIELHTPKMLTFTQMVNRKNLGLVFILVSSIISRHHRRDDTIKIACFKVQRKFRLFLVIGAILFLFLLTLIIVLSTSGKKHLDSSENEPENMPQNTNDKTHGKFSRGLVGITALGGLWLSGRALASGAEGPEFEPPPG